MAPTILIVDDEPRSLESLRRTLEEDFRVFTAGGAVDALAIMQAESIDIVLTDQRMPETSGVTFLKQVREQWPETVRIIISGYTDSEDIIAGLNEAGIYQYLLKPWHPDQLLLILRQAVELQRLQRENHQLALELRTSEPALRKQTENSRRRLRQTFALNNIVCAQDSPLRGVCSMVERAACYDVSILLTGESGTGKELLARAVHYAGARSERPFVVQNCGALPDTLLESELFGHKKGAFTGAFEERIGLFQQAHGGTLFLDEVGETSPAFQVKLLRVLQEGECRPLGSNRPISVDVRIVAATNRNLAEEVQAGRFRGDLFYRLATLPIEVPPLRDRPMDIALLARSMLEKFATVLGRRVDGFAPETMSAMMAYAWPGNVRELQNEIQRMLVLSDGPLLTLELLSSHIHATDPLSLGASGLRGRVGAVEAQLLAETLDRHAGNVSRAAQELGVSRPGLRNKMRRLGVATTVRGRGRPARNEAENG